MRREFFHEATMQVRVPRGIDGFWFVIMQHGADGRTFTIDDISDETDVARGDIQHYIWGLAKAGFLKCIDHGAKPPARMRRAVFVLVKPQSTAPHVRKDGSIVPPTAQELLWTAMRSLKTFGLKELAFAAQTDDVKPAYELTKKFVQRLAGAGYLAPETAPLQRGSRPARWRLKPSMDTGPKPPQRRRLKAEAMWDPNLRKFVGEAPVATEAIR